MKKAERPKPTDLRFDFARIGSFIENAKKGVIRNDELKSAETALMRILGIIYGVDAGMVCWGGRPYWPPLE